MIEGAAADSRPGYQRPVMILLLSAGAVILAASVSPYWRVTPDAALYTGIARSLATGQGYTFAGEPQYSISPAMPACFALIYRAVHLFRPDLSLLDTVLYFNIFSACAAMAGLVAAYYLALELAGARRALVVLAFLVCSRQYHFYSIRQLTDVPYSAVSWAALLFVLKADANPKRIYLAWAAFFLTLAPLVRLTGAVLVLSVIFYYGFAVVSGKGDRRQNLAKLLAAVPGLVASAVFVCLVLCAREGATFNYYNHFFKGLSPVALAERYAANLWDLARSLFTVIFKRDRVATVPFLLLVSFGAFQFFRTRKKLPLLYIALFVLYTPFGQAVPVRYAIPLVPFLVIFAIEGIWRIGRALALVFPGGTARAVLRGVAALVVIWAVYLNLGKMYEEISYNYSGRFYSTCEHGLYLRQCMEIAQALRENPPEGRIMTEDARVFTAISGMDTARLFFYPETEYEYSIQGVTKFVSDRDVTAIVVREDQSRIAVMVTAFVNEGPYVWRRTARNERFSLYVLERGAEGKGESSGGEG